MLQKRDAGSGRRGWGGGHAEPWRQSLREDDTPKISGRGVGATRMPGPCLPETPRAPKFRGEKQNWMQKKKTVLGLAAVRDIAEGA